MRLVKWVNPERKRSPGRGQGPSADAKRESEQGVRCWCGYPDTQMQAHASACVCLCVSGGNKPTQPPSPGGVAGDSWLGRLTHDIKLEHVLVGKGKPQSCGDVFKGHGSQARGPPQPSGDQFKPQSDGNRLRRGGACQESQPLKRPSREIPSSRELDNLARSGLRP